MKQDNPFEKLLPANKPKYIEGQVVYFNLDGKIKGTGIIRGLATEHIIDFWIVQIVEADGIDKNTYPWSCATMPHTSLSLAVPSF